MTEKRGSSNGNALRWVAQVARNKFEMCDGSVPSTEYKDHEHATQVGFSVASKYSRYP